MTVLSTIQNGDSGKDIRDTINDLLTNVKNSKAIGLVLPSATTISTSTIDSSVNNILLMGYAVAGDCPTFRVRRVLAPEANVLALGSLFTSTDGAKWVISETTLISQWFGAKGNASGFSATNPNTAIAAAAGNDDAPAWRSMLEMMSALQIRGDTLTGCKHRFGSHVAHQGGQKTVLLPGSNTHLTIRCDLIHDSFDSTSGSPMFFFTNGLVNNRIKRISLRFEGGRLVFPSDAVAPRRADDAQGNPVYAKKGSITMYYVDDFHISRASVTGPSPTNFQISIFHSSSGIIDGGFVGYPVGPTGVGDDGFHLIGECRDIVARGFIVNSGDDPISITCENNMTAKTIERILISDFVCTTPIANIIKIHIVNDEALGGTDKTNGCIIQDVRIENVWGRLLGNLQGAAITINNDDPSKSNIIRRIYIDKVNVDIGTLPKINPTVSLQGQAVRVYKAEDIHITNTTIVGQQNSQLCFVSSKSSSFNGTLTNVVNNANVPTLLTGLSIASAVIQSSSLRRITFNNSPDLSAVFTQLDAAVKFVNVNDLKFPILNVTGMATAGHNGSFVIRGVDNTNKWVDVENYRGGTNNETSGSTGTASITVSTMPVVMLLDCDDIKVNAKVKNPLAWATAYISARATSTSVSQRCEVILDIDGQTYGDGIRSVRAVQGRYSVTGRSCKSGGYMMRTETSGAVVEPYNHWLNSDDFGSLADPQMGWGRTMLSEYASDRFDVIRGRSPTRFRGTVKQLAGVATLGTLVSAGVYSGIGANASTYGGCLSSFVTPAHLLKLTPRSSGHDGVTDITWDVTNAKFVVNTKSAPTADVTWDFVVGFPD